MATSVLQHSLQAELYRDAIIAAGCMHRLIRCEQFTDMHTTSNTFKGVLLQCLARISAGRAALFATGHSMRAKRDQMDASARLRSA